MSPLAQAIGQRFEVEVLLQKPSTVITIKSNNQAWLKKFYYKVIAANMVITYKYLNLKSKKNRNFPRTGSRQKKPLIPFTTLLSGTES